MQAFSVLGFTRSSTATIGLNMFYFESNVTKKDTNIMRGKRSKNRGEQ